MKKVVKLNQEELKHIVTESAMRILNEDMGGIQGQTYPQGNGIDPSLPGVQKTYDRKPNQVPTSQQVNTGMQIDKKMAYANLKKWGYTGKGSWIPLAVKNGLTDQEINAMRNALTGTPGKFNSNNNANYNKYRTTPQKQYNGSMSSNQVGSNIRGEKTMKNMYESNEQMDTDQQMNENVAAIAKAVLPYVEKYLMSKVVEKGMDEISDKLGNKSKEDKCEKSNEIDEAVRRVIRRNVR